ncbi:hypothetical protein [Streptomyces lydicus]
MKAAAEAAGTDNNALALIDVRAKRSQSPVQVFDAFVLLSFSMAMPVFE